MNGKIIIHLIGILVLINLVGCGSIGYEVNKYKDDGKTLDYTINEHSTNLVGKTVIVDNDVTAFRATTSFDPSTMAATPEVDFGFFRSIIIGFPMRPGSTFTYFNETKSSWTNYVGGRTFIHIECGIGDDLGKVRITINPKTIINVPGLKIQNPLDPNGTDVKVDVMPKAQELKQDGGK